MKRRDIKNLAKRIIKNHIIFRKKILFDADFSEKLRLLMDKYGSPEKTKDVIFSIVSGREYLADNYKSTLESASYKFTKEALATFKSFDENLKRELSSAVFNFLAEFCFGKEWKDTLIILITTGKFYPPRRNFHVGGDITDKKRVVITINPDTSLEDLAADWDIIKGLQKILWPDFKKTNVTKQSIKSIDVSFRTEMTRIIEADKENRDKLSDYEKQLYDFMDLKKSENAINAFRAKKNLTGEGKKTKPVKLKTRITYKKLNKINKGNKNSYNSLNQQRKRAQK